MARNLSGASIAARPAYWAKGLFPKREPSEAVRDKVSLVQEADPLNTRTAGGIWKCGCKESADPW